MTCHRSTKRTALMAFLRMKANGQLDFSDPAAIMQLTKTLLKLDFGLKIELPGDRLCPTVSKAFFWLGTLPLTASRYLIVTTTSCG